MRDQIVRKLVVSWEGVLARKPSTPDDLKELSIRLKMFIGIIESTRYNFFSLDQVSRYFHAVQKMINEQSTISDDRRISWERLFNDDFCKLEGLFEAGWKKLMRSYGEEFPQPPPLLLGRTRLMPQGWFQVCWLCGDPKRADVFGNQVREELYVDKNVMTDFGIGFVTDYYPSVDIELRETSPLITDPYKWDEIFEASLELGGVLSIFAERWDGADFALSGSHIARIHSNRTLYQRKFTPSGFHYLIQIWPGKREHKTFLKR